jgi:WD40 repeat protein
MEASLSKDSADPQSEVTQSTSLPTSIARFQIREKLGEGGFGSVYRAYDPVLDRETALKVPHGSSNIKRQYDRILKEAKAAARLRHPNIVAVFEVGSALERPFIAAEYVKGRTLSAVMKETSDDRMADLRQHVEWLTAIARGLSYAHREGIVHRDVKPHNILIDETGRAQLTDFGLAMQLTEAESEDRKNAIVGTLGYLSPEQAAGDQSQVGPPADQYALGVVLFELLAERRPFEGQSYSLINQIINDAVPRPSTIAENVSLDLECICLKALSRNVAGRYESCDHLADDLQRWLDGELVEATNPTWLRRVIHWGRRRPQLAAWAITAASLILLATGSTITIAVQHKLENDRLALEAEQLRQDATASDEENEATRAALALAEQQRVAAVAKNEAVEYANQLARVRDAIAEYRLDDAHRMLDEVPWNQRHVEHGLLRREAMGTPYILRHGSAVEKLVWSRDGRILASVGRDGTIRFWSGETGELKGSQSFPGGIDAEFSPTSDTLWIVISDHATKTTVLESYRLVETAADVRLEPNVGKLQLDLLATSLCINPSGTLVGVTGSAATGKPGLLICDIGNPEPSVLHAPDGLPNEISDAAFRSLGDQLVCKVVARSSDGQLDVTLFSVDSASGTVSELKASATDAGVLATATTAQAVTGQEEQPEYFRGQTSHVDNFNQGWQEPNENVTARLEVSPKTPLLGYQSGRIRHPGEVPADWHGHTSAISCFAQRPDGKCLASADYSGEIRLWPTSLQTRFGVTQKELGDKPLGRASHNFDGTLAACAVPQDESGELPVWSTTTGEIVRRLTGHSNGIPLVQFHPKANRLITIDGAAVVRYWDTTDGIVIHQWELEPGSIEDAAFDPEGNILALVGGSSAQPQPVTADPPAENTTTAIVSLWNPETGAKSVSMSGHAGKVVRVAFAPDGRHLFTASADGTVRGWSPIDGVEQIKLECGEMVPIDLAVSQSAVGIVAKEKCAADVQAKTQVMAWDRNDHSRMYSIPQNEYPFRSLDLSDDGRRLVLVSEAEVAIHDASAGNRLHVLPISLRTQAVMEAHEKTYTVMVPYQEQRNGTRRACKMVTETREEQYSVVVNGQTETRTRTVSVPKRVYEQVEFTYTITVCRPETRTATYMVVKKVTEGSVPLEAKFLPNSEGVLVSGTQSASVLDATTPWAVRELTGTETIHEGFAVNQTGDTLASYGRLNSGCDQSAGIDVWNTATGKPVQSLRRPGEFVNAMLIQPGTGNLIVALGKRDPRMPYFDPAAVPIEAAAAGVTGEEPTFRADSGRSQGGTATAPDFRIELIDVNSGGTLQTFASEDLNSPVRMLAASIQPALLMSIDDQGSLQLWDLNDGTLIQSRSKTGATRIALSPDGHVALIQDSNGVSVCRTESLDQRWQIAVDSASLDPSACPESVTFFQASRDGSSVFLLTGTPDAGAQAPIPVVVDFADLTEGLANADSTKEVELQSRLSDESLSWVLDVSANSVSGSGGCYLMQAGGPADQGHLFLSTLYQDLGSNLSGPSYSDDGHVLSVFNFSTILQWNPTAARKLQERFRITTPASKKVIPRATESGPKVAPGLLLFPPPRIETGVQGDDEPAPPAPVADPSVPAPAGV